MERYDNIRVVLRNLTAIRRGMVKELRYSNKELRDIKSTVWLKVDDFSYHVYQKTVDNIKENQSVQ